MDREQIREEFDHFDRDKNGRIDRAEFAELMRTLDADMSDEELTVGFDAIDTDGNGTIDFDEFVDWWS